MNPYEADPTKIPSSDIYADVPLYGRYCPKPDDFRVDFQHINSQTTDSVRYWASVIKLCTEEIRIYPADEGGRDVFALGGVIVKSSHLHARDGTTCMEIDFSYADANEIQAIALAKTALKGVRVPEIYFAGKVFAPAFRCRLCDSRLLRLMVAKCSFKKGFQASDCLLHGLISRRTRRSPTNNRLERYSINFTHLNLQRNSNLAPMWCQTLTYL